MRGLSPVALIEPSGKGKFLFGKIKNVSNKNERKIKRFWEKKIYVIYFQIFDI